LCAGPASDSPPVNRRVVLRILRGVAGALHRQFCPPDQRRKKARKRQCLRAFSYWLGILDSNQDRQIQSFPTARFPLMDYCLLTWIFLATFAVSDILRYATIDHV
jgi:hypothetical protein